MANKLITLDLPASLKGPLGRGHPWIYRNHIAQAPDLESGTWVKVRCAGFTGFGLWDAQSPIAVRLLSRTGEADADWVADRIAEAWALREAVRSHATSGYRWVHGESDGLPGIIVDLYGEFAVIRTYAESVQVLVPWVADALHAHTDLKGIVWRHAESRMESLWGRLPPSNYTIEEHGLLFAVDLFSGQKTGFFFDQRENRLWVSPWCQGKTVLDCFCYSGAFSVYALRGGAESVIACDISGGAVDAARKNLILNGFDADHSSLLVGDCYTLLDSFARETRRFDVVVLDPPSLARNRQSRHAAERAYVRLNQRALRCVREGGLLASASCTSQVSPPAFRQALAEAARQAGRRLQILHDAGQAVDHPVPAHFPEARYLKFMLCRVLPIS